MRNVLIGWLILVNLWGFGLCFWDKRQARHGGWRVEEKTFFALAFLGAAAGIRLSMHWFRHKTKKRSFFWVIDWALICNAAVLWGLFWIGLK